jgi:hypothetical protein
MLINRAWSRVTLALAIPLAIVAVAGGGLVLASRGDSSSGPGQDTAIAAVDIETGTAHLLSAPGDRQPFEAYLEALAANLGISVAQLKAALKKTAFDAIDKAVAENRMSAEMAAKLKEKIEAGDWIPFGPIPGHLPKPAGPGGPAGPGAGPGRPSGQGGPGPLLPMFGFGPIDQALADFLGKTLDEVRAGLNSGKTPAQLIEAAGKQRAEFEAFLKQKVSDAMAKAVAAQKLTQQQADEMLKRLSEHIAKLLDGNFRIRPMGPGGDRPGRDGFPRPGTGVPPGSGQPRPVS